MKVLGLDIGGTYIKTGIIDETGRVYETGEIPTNAHLGGQVLMNRILEIIGEYKDKDVNLIGISTAGQVDVKTGSIIHATDNIPGWTGMEIKRIIEEKFNIPTWVENDVNAAALGEAVFGAAKGEKSFLCVTYGTGIGGAIVENGEIYRGAYGSAGEFGHIITHVGGRACTCGGNGCYEAYASVTALINDVMKQTGMTGITGRDVFRIMEEGNRDVQRIIDNWLDEVLAGLVSLIHIFNPSCIVLGGGVMNQDYSIEYIRSNIKSRIMQNYRKVAVKKALLGNHAGLLGAAFIALKASGVIEI